MSWQSRLVSCTSTCIALALNMGSLKTFLYFSCDATIHLSYSYARRPSETPSEVFQTRQIIYPIDITVYSVLECRSMDIVPHWQTKGTASAPAFLSQQDIDRYLLGVGQETDWCLFAIDVQNNHNTPFQVTITRESEGNAQKD